MPYEIQPNPVLGAYRWLYSRLGGRPFTEVIRTQWYNPIWWLCVGLLVGRWMPWGWWLPLGVGIVVGHLWWGGWSLAQRERHKRSGEAPKGGG